MGRSDNEIPVTDSEPLQLGANMRLKRQQKRVTLTEMAELLGYTKSHLSAVENGNGRASHELVEKYERELKLTPGDLTMFRKEDRSRKRSGLSSMSKKVREKIEQSLEPNEASSRLVTDQEHILEEPRRHRNLSHQSNDLLTKRIDLGEIPRAEQFFGREQELTKFREWIVGDHCQLVAVLGIGGIGKTTLAARLSQMMEEEFGYVYWRSLQNAPPLESLLKNCIAFLANHKRIDVPADTDGQIAMLMKYLQESRCLIILDNFEAVMLEGVQAGHYKRGYEEYGKLLTRLGEVKHQSCVILTSREKPKEFTLLEGRTSPVRSELIQGVEKSAARKILEDKRLQGSSESWDKLIALYSGNPLYLKLVSEPIVELFGGDIDEFLKKPGPIVSNISDPLEMQFSRLSEQERMIIYWLAIVREGMSLDDLSEYMIFPQSVDKLVETFGSLKRRSLIEVSNTERFTRFTLQPVVMEFVTERFIAQVCDEIRTEQVEILASHPLIIAQAKVYVRKSQERLILLPVVERLLMSLGRVESEKKLKEILAGLRKRQPQTQGYTAGNVLNLLIQLGIELRGWDFSGLIIWQAYLQGKDLRGVNFAQADLRKSVFTDAFGGILSVAISHHRDQLAAGTVNGQIRLWSATDGTPNLICDGHSDWVGSVVFSRDGSKLASGSEDKTVRLWDATTGQCLKTLRGHDGRVYSVTFSPDGSKLASGSEDKTVRLWDVNSGECLENLQEHDNWVYSVAFSPDGSKLASGSVDQTVRLWDTSKGQCIKVLQGYSTWIYAIALSPEGPILASGSDENTIRLWDIRKSKSLKVLQGHTNGIRSVAFSPDGSKLASGSEDKTLRLWDVNSGECLKILQGHENWVYWVAFSPDGTKLASGSHDATIRLWNVSTGQCIKIIKSDGRMVYSVAFNPDGNILASGSDDNEIRLWNVDTGECIKVLPGHENRVWPIVFSQDKKLLASGSDDKTVKLWDAKTGEYIDTLKGHTSWVCALAFTPDSSVLASGSYDGTIKIWNVQTKKQSGILKSDRPYEGMNITELRGVTEAQKAILRSLGAKDDTDILNTSVGYSSSFSLDPALQTV